MLIVEIFKKRKKKKKTTLSTILLNESNLKYHFVSLQIVFWWDFIFQNKVQSYYVCFVICFFSLNKKYCHVSKYSATYFLVVI